jgi:hypothetical protein
LFINHDFCTTPRDTGVLWGGVFEPPHDGIRPTGRADAALMLVKGLIDRNALGNLTLSEQGRAALAALLKGRS